MSVKCEIVTAFNKQCPDNVIITSVFFLCCSEALTCESPEFLWTYLTSDLLSMCRRQQIAAAGMEGPRLVLTHRLQFRLTETCLLRGNNGWVRISDYYKWFWLVFTINDLLRHILYPPIHMRPGRCESLKHFNSQAITAVKKWNMLMLTDISYIWNIYNTKKVLFKKCDIW